VRARWMEMVASRYPRCKNHLNRSRRLNISGGGIRMFQRQLRRYVVYSRCSALD
jgi:hypothetical protein